jgi:hypothetical protein
MVRWIAIALVASLVFAAIAVAFTVWLFGG